MSEENLKDEISLVELVEKGKDWFYFLVTKWTIIFASIILGATIGLIYSCFKKPIYTATLTFALEDDGSGGGLSSAMGLASQFGFDIGGNGGGAFEDSNLLELFKSHKIVVQTLLNPVDFKNKRISLAELYIQDCGWREKWNNDPNLKSLKFLPKSNRENLTRKHDSILGLIYQDLYTNSLSVTKKDKKIDITSIEVISINEFFAKSFAESLVKEVSDFYIETKS